MNTEYQQGVRDCWWRMCGAHCIDNTCHGNRCRYGKAQYIIPQDLSVLPHCTFDYCPRVDQLRKR